MLRINNLVATIAIMAAISIGTSVVTSLLQPKVHLPPVDAGRHDDIRVMGSEYGTMIPIVYGRARLAGNIIWSDGIQPIVTTTPGRSGGKKSAPTAPTNNYSYYTNLAIAICEGEIKGGLRRMWENENVTINLDINADPANFGASYEAEDPVNILTNGAYVASDPAASGSAKVVLPNSTSSLKFTGIVASATAAWEALIVYSAEADFSCMVKVNSDPAVEYFFDTTGSFNTFSAITIPINVNAGSSNTIEIFRNSSAPAPNIDLVRIYDPNQTIPGSGFPRLVSGVPATSQTAAENEWKYYYINVPPGASQLQVTGIGSGDGALYTKFSEQPTLSSHDCLAYNPSPEICTHSSPKAGIWWIGVYGHAGGVNFSVTATVTGGGIISSSNPEFSGGGNVTGILDPLAVPNDDNNPRSQFNGEAFLDDSGGGVKDTQTGTIGSIGGSGNIGNFTFYTGSEVQEQDSLMVGIDGASVTPAYRGISYIVLANYNIPNGALPNFSFEIEEGTHDLSEILAHLYGRVGLTSQYLDFSAVHGIYVEGLVVTQRTELSQILDALQIAYNFDLLDADGKIKAVLRGGSSIVTIPKEELRAYEAGSQTPEADLESDFIDESQLPEKIDVSFVDKRFNYHQNVQSAQRQFGGTADPQTVTLPLVMSANQARQLSFRVLYSLHLMQIQQQFSLGPKYLYLLPTDIISLQFPTVTHTLRLMQMQANVPGFLKFQAVPEKASLYSQVETDNSGEGTTPPVVKYPANSKLILMDVPPVVNQDSGIGYYSSVCARGVGNWTGAVLFKQDSSGAYVRVNDFSEQGTIGIVITGTLSGSPTYDGDGFDTTSDLHISLFNGSLETVLTADILNDPHLNLAFIGGEWIQFVNAVSEIAPFPYLTSYHVTKILRGRFSTLDRISGHNVDEDFVLYNSAVKFTSDTSRSNFVGANFKALTLGQPIDNAEIVIFGSAGSNAPPVVSWDSSIVAAGSSPTLHDAGIIIDSNYGINNTFNPYILGYIKFGAYAAVQRARIYWTAPSSSEVATDIILRPDASNRSSFRFTAPKSGTHTFRAVSEDEFGQSNGLLPHPSASVLVAPIVQSIDFPTNLQTVIGTKTVTFSWDLPTNNPERVTAYEIWKSTSTGTPSNRLATVKGRSWTETLSEFTFDSYTRYIRAIDDMGNNSSFVQFSFPSPLDSNLKIFDNVVPKDNLSGLGLTIGVAKVSGSGSWFGASVYRDRGYGYELVATLEETEEEATIGHTTDNSTSWLGDDGGYDILWVIKEGGEDFTNATLSEITAGKNNLFVGREKIGVQTWTDMGSGLWKGEDLVRGLNHTEIFMTSHTAQEDVILLNERAKFIPIELRDIGQTLNFKAVTFGQDIGAISPVSMAIRGDSLRPYALSTRTATRDNSGDWHLAAINNTRGSDAPASFIFRIRRVSDGALLRDLPIPASTFSLAGMFKDSSVGSHDVSIVNNNVTSVSPFSQSAVIGLQNIDNTGIGITGKMTLPKSDMLYSGSRTFASVALLTNSESDSFSGYAVCEVQWNGSATWEDFEVFGFENVSHNLTDSPVIVPALDGVIYFLMAIVGTEFRFYLSTSGVPVPGTTTATLKGSFAFAEFPVRLRLMVNGGSKFENVWISGLNEPHSIYALRQQAADLVNLGVSDVTAASGSSTLDVEMWEVSKYDELDNKGFSVREVF